MEARLQLRVQRYGWDRAAPHYERGWARVLAPATQAVLDAAAVSAGESVLDVACGSGLLTLPAARAAGPGARIVATDLSTDMLAAARQACDATGLHHVRCVHADAQKLDEALGDERFDVVLCGLGLMYVPDAEAAIAAMARRLRPDGRIVVSVWGERAECGWSAVFPIVDARVRSEVCPLFFRLGAGDTLAAALAGAGLRDVQVRRVRTQLHFDDALSVCHAAFEGGPVALAYAHFDDRTRAAVHREYLEAVDRWRDGSGYRLPGSFVVAAGRRDAG